MDLKNLAWFDPSSVFLLDPRHLLVVDKESQQCFGPTLGAWPSREEVIEGCLGFCSLSCNMQSQHCCSQNTTTELCLGFLCGAEGSQIRWGRPPDALEMMTNTSFTDQLSFHSTCCWGEEQRWGLWSPQEPWGVQRCSAKCLSG